MRASADTDVLQNTRQRSSGPSLFLGWFWGNAKGGQHACTHADRAQIDRAGRREQRKRETGGEGAESVSLGIALAEGIGDGFGLLLRRDLVPRLLQPSGAHVKALSGDPAAAAERKSCGMSSDGMRSVPVEGGRDSGFSRARSRPGTPGAGPRPACACPSCASWRRRRRTAAAAPWRARAPLPPPTDPRRRASVQSVGSGQMVPQMVLAAAAGRTHRPSAAASK